MFRDEKEELKQSLIRDEADQMTRDLLENEAKERKIALENEAKERKIAEERYVTDLFWMYFTFLWPLLGPKPFFRNAIIGTKSVDVKDVLIIQNGSNFSWDISK